MGIEKRHCSVFMMLFCYGFILLFILGKMHRVEEGMGSSFIVPFFLLVDIMRVRECVLWDRF